MTMMEKTWIEVGPLVAIPERGARIVKTRNGDIAVFRTAAGEAFALDDRCPHRGAPLSQGIVHGGSVTCPLHNWVIDLATGEAQGADKGCARRIPVRVENGRVFVDASALAARGVAAGAPGV